MRGVNLFNNLKYICRTSITRRSVGTYSVTENKEPLKPFSAIPTIKFSKFLKDVAGLKNDPQVFDDYLFNNLIKSLAEHEEGLAVLSAGPLKPPTIIVSKPELIEKFLRDCGSLPARPVFDGINIKRRQEVESGGYQSMGLLAVDGEEWWNLRKKVQQPMLRPQALQRYTPLLDDIAKDFINNLVRRKLDPETNQTPDDFLMDIHLWALESVSYLALDTRIGCLSPTSISQDSNQMQLVENSGIMAKETLILDYDPGLLRYCPTMFKRYRSLSRATDNVDNITRGYINKAMERYKKNPSHDEEIMLSLFMKNGCTEDEATVMASELMLAGIDTSSHTVAWTLYRLASNEQVQESLINEIKTILPDKNSVLDNAKLEKMSYLKAVLKESQRIMPVVPFNVRTLGPDYSIGGYDIDRPCRFVSANQLMCVSDKHFKDPLQFRPERWLRGHCQKENVHPFVWLPFGHGPRMCVGRRFAELEIKILLCRMVQNFKLEWNQEKPLGYFPSLLNKPDVPVKLTLKPRD